MVDNNGGGGGCGGSGDTNNFFTHSGKSDFVKIKWHGLKYHQLEVMQRTPTTRCSPVVHYLYILLPPNFHFVFQLTDGSDRCI